MKTVDHEEIDNKAGPACAGSPEIHHLCNLQQRQFRKEIPVGLESLG